MGVAILSRCVANDTVIIHVFVIDFCVWVSSSFVVIQMIPSLQKGSLPRNEILSRSHKETFPEITSPGGPCEISSSIKQWIGPGRKRLVRSNVSLIRPLMLLYTIDYVLFVFGPSFRKLPSWEVAEQCITEIVPPGSAPKSKSKGLNWTRLQKPTWCLLLLCTLLCFVASGLSYTRFIQKMYSINLHQKLWYSSRSQAALSKWKRCAPRLSISCALIWLVS